MEDLSVLSENDEGVADEPFIPVYDAALSRNYNEYGNTISQAMRYGMSNR